MSRSTARESFLDGTRIISRRHGNCFSTGREIFPVGWVGLVRCALGFAGRRPRRPPLARVAPPRGGEGPPRVGVVERGAMETRAGVGGAPGMSPSTRALTVPTVGKRAGGGDSHDYWNISIMNRTTRPFSVIMRRQRQGTVPREAGDNPPEKRHQMGWQMAVSRSRGTSRAWSARTRSLRPRTPIG